MTSSAMRSPSRKASFASLGTVAVVFVLGAAWAQAQVAPGTVAAPVAVSETSKAAPAPVPFHHFPNVVVRTHEGRNVRFYDDLLKGKIVLISFMYADCKKR